MAIRPGKKKPSTAAPGLVVPTLSQPGKPVTGAVFETVGIATLQRTVVRDCDCSIRCSNLRVFTMDLKQVIGLPFEFRTDSLVRAVHRVHQDADLLQVVFLGLYVMTDASLRIRAAVAKNLDCRARVQHPLGKILATRQTVFHYLVREDHVIQT